jgi:hypothetical protein
MAVSFKKIPLKAILFGWLSNHPGEHLLLVYRLVSIPETACLSMKTKRAETGHPLARNYNKLLTGP